MAQHVPSERHGLPGPLAAFAVPPLYQHRVLFWGVLGALAMRAAFIFAGSALLELVPKGSASHP